MLPITICTKTYCNMIRSLALYILIKKAILLNIAKLFTRTNEPNISNYIIIQERTEVTYRLRVLEIHYDFTGGLCVTKRSAKYVSQYTHRYAKRNCVLNESYI